MSVPDTDQHRIAFVSLNVFKRFNEYVLRLCWIEERRYIWPVIQCLRYCVLDGLALTQAERSAPIAPSQLT
jgi:hypothetical protein